MFGLLYVENIFFFCWKQYAIVFDCIEMKNIIKLVF